MVLTLFASAALSLTSMDADPEIFAGETNVPSETVTTVSADCPVDHVQITFATRGQISLVKRISINKTVVKASGLGMINVLLADRSIDRARWEECPINKADDAPVRLYLDLRTNTVPAMNRGRVLLISRDGAVNAE